MADPDTQPSTPAPGPADLRAELDALLAATFCEPYLPAEVIEARLDGRSELVGELLFVMGMTADSSGQVSFAIAAGDLVRAAWALDHDPEGEERVRIFINSARKNLADPRAVQWMQSMKAEAVTGDV